MRSQAVLAAVSFASTVLFVAGCGGSLGANGQKHAHRAGGVTQPPLSAPTDPLFTLTPGEERMYQRGQLQAGDIIFCITGAMTVSATVPANAVAPSSYTSAGTDSFDQTGQASIEIKRGPGGSFVARCTP